MKSLLHYILVFSQLITLGVWASAPMELSQGLDAAHVHLDLHQHEGTPHQYSEGETTDEHEHSENCHVHLSVQLIQDSHLSNAATPKAVLREALVLSHTNLEHRPPVPPPSTLNS